MDKRLLLIFLVLSGAIFVLSSETVLRLERAIPYGYLYDSTVYTMMVLSSVASGAVVCFLALDLYYLQEQEVKALDV